MNKYGINFLEQWCSREVFFQSRKCFSCHAC